MAICLVQFAKTPEAGKVKTRLHPYLTAENCLQLHKQLVEHTLQSCGGMDSIPLQLWSTSGGDWIEAMCAKYGVKHHLQCGGDLGERLTHALQHCLADYDAVIFIGSDCPAINAELVQNVARCLSASPNELALVPATDGGYVMLGVSGYFPSIFENITWSSEHVFEQTRVRAHKAGLNVSVFPALSDIDRPEDLPSHELGRAFFYG